MDTPNDAKEFAEIDALSGLKDTLDANANIEDVFGTPYDIHWNGDADVIFNQPDQVDGDAGADGLFNSPHQENPNPLVDSIAHNLHHVDLAVLINAGDAAHTAHVRSRTYAHLNQTHTEQSLSNPQDAHPHENDMRMSGSVVAMDTLEFEQPQVKKRRTQDRDSSEASVITRLSSSTVSTDRTSLVSTSTAPTPTDTTQETYVCPICNMGDGHRARAYIRKANSTADLHGSAGTPEPTSQSNPRNSFKSATWFNRHVKEDHKNVFLRTNSSEYTCRLCPCQFVLKQPTCAARFTHIDDLLRHLGEVHGQASKLRIWYDHCCDPLSTSSYLPPIRNSAEQQG